VHGLVPDAPTRTDWAINSKAKLRRPPPPPPPPLALLSSGAGAVPGTHREEGLGFSAGAQIPRESGCAPPTPGHVGPQGTRLLHPGCPMARASILARESADIQVSIWAYNLGGGKEQWGNIAGAKDTLSSSSTPFGSRMQAASFPLFNFGGLWQSKRG
jgi:hypothetical protein